MKKCVSIIVLCSLFVCLAAPAVACASSTDVDTTSLSFPVQQLIADEFLRPLRYDDEGNLILLSPTGHEVVMTKGFLEVYGRATGDCEMHLESTCPCSCPARIWDIIKELYTVYCICREIINFAKTVSRGWGECSSPGYYFINCDIINGLVYWR